MPHMSPSPYIPLLVLTRGDIVESIHYGAVAVVDSSGQLVCSTGDPQAVTFLRSTAKPLQALPFIERGGHTAYNLLPAEIALLCASHSGTDEHVATALSIQSKTGVLESDLLCGVHPPGDEHTAEMLRQRGEQPTPNRHNCSGKHTGMVAFARSSNLPYDDYVNFNHPIQKIILQTVAEMSSLLPKDIALGIDGCSAPNFAMPLYNAALAYARLCDPQELEPARAAACRVITTAMTSHPDMVGGPGRFDTRLMEVAQGRIVAKGGAEGYQGIGLLPGALGHGSPALGIAMKIADGDIRGRARPAVALEVLRRLRALSEADLQALSEFGPTIPIRNWRKLLVGEARPEFDLQCEQ